MTALFHSCPRRRKDLENIFIKRSFFTNEILSMTKSMFFNARNISCTFLPKINEDFSKKILHLSKFQIVLSVIRIVFCITMYFRRQCKNNVSVKQTS